MWCKIRLPGVSADKGDSVTSVEVTAQAISEHTIRYDIEEFNVDSKAKYSALSSALSRKKKLKTNKCQCSYNSVQVKIREGSPEGTRVIEERICKRDEF